MMTRIYAVLDESPWWCTSVLYVACVCVAYVLLEHLVGRDDQ